MLSLDHHLFLLLNADADASGWWHLAGHFLAVHAHWVLLVLVLVLALRRWRSLVRPVMAGVLAIAIGSLACELIAMLWDRPRPFESGLGHPHLRHVGSPSFPSSHATAYVALACSFLMMASYRPVGGALLVLAAVVSIARVVLGVHYPLDIAGGALVGGVAAVAAHGLIERISWVTGLRASRGSQ